MEVWLNYVVLILIMTIFAVSLNLLLGHAGVLSSAHAALGAAGGYATAYLSLSRGWSPWLALLVGVVVATAVGLLLAVPSLPLSPEYLILLTLVAGEALLTVISANRSLGGTFGLTNLPRAVLFGQVLDRATAWVLPLTLITAAVFALCWRLGESPYGRVLRATRDDDRAAAAVGTHIFGYRLWVFGITSGLAGLGGGLYAMYLGVASPQVFSFDVSMAIFSMVVLGGMGNLVGSVLGASALTLITPVMQRVVELPPERASFVRIAIYGLLLVLLVRFRPEGLLPEYWGRRARAGAGAADANDEPPAELAARVRSHGLNHGPTSAMRSGAAVVPAREPADADGEAVALRARGLGKRFGGVVAAENLDLDLPTGTITALVGPNGAGKTTVFNLLTGFLRPDAGAVELLGADVSGLRPDQIARAGLIRTFQDVRLWPRMSVLDNVALAVPDQPGERIGPLLTHPAAVARREREVRDQAHAWLGFVGLADRGDDLAGSLSYGQSKLISLARAMASQAPVVLLDEPVSGVDTAWADVMLALVDAMRAAGRTICLVEHNLHVVEQLADQAYFMDLGRIIARGTMAELTSSADLARTYFGLST